MRHALQALFSPSRGSALPGNLCPLFWRQFVGASFPALASERLRGLILAVVFEFVRFLASGDSQNLDGSADHVGGSLLAFWSSWHGRSYSCLPLSLRERTIERRLPGVQNPSKVFVPCFFARERIYISTKLFCSSGEATGPARRDGGGLSTESCGRKCRPIVSSVISMCYANF